jgi:aminoglycoside 6-adenylyltransferase
LDKDNRIPPLPTSSDLGYLVRKPARKRFEKTVNDIFWCANNVAKGIWRDELAYAKYMLEVVVRGEVLHLLEWYAAMRHDWSISTGAYGKWLKKFLPPQVWALYIRTYPGAEYADIWDALFAVCRLTRQVGPELAQHLGYRYPFEDDRRVVAYLEHVRALPRTAVDFEDR